MTLHAAGSMAEVVRSDHSACLVHLFHEHAYIVKPRGRQRRSSRCATAAKITPGGPIVFSAYVAGDYLVPWSVRPSLDTPLRARTVIGGWMVGSLDQRSARTGRVSKVRHATGHSGGTRTMVPRAGSGGWRRAEEDEEGGRLQCGGEHECQRRCR